MRASRVAPFWLLLLLACGEGARERPFDACASHNDDRAACWAAVDDQGSECIFAETGESCGTTEELGCFGSAYAVCESDDDCPADHGCVMIQRPACEPSETGAQCAACGAREVGMCFLE